MKCPTCDHNMIPSQVDKIEIDMCTNCGGTWFDTEEFEELFGTMRCPLCRRVMVMRELRGVEYDFCTSCGSVWLDQGELGILVEREPKRLGRDSNLRKFLDDTIVARNVLLATDSTFTDLPSADPVIDEIFLVHDSGILIAHATRRLKPDQDDAILSAMLVAIQGFVQESFKDDSDVGLREIAFGNRRILLHKGEHVLLAVIVAEDVDVSAEEIEHTRGDMVEVVLAIETQFAEVFKEWDGFVERFRGARDIISRIFQ